MTTGNEIDTTQFKDTPIIRKLKETEESKPKSTRGRKRKYNTPEERLAARRIQQKAYRERKKAEFAALKSKSEGSGDDGANRTEADSE